MDNPTQEQIKEFWEWCRFELVSRFGGSLSQATEYLWKYPNGSHYKDTPSIDLNSLFRYAVPKLREWDINARIEIAIQFSTTVRIYKSNPADDDYPTLQVAYKSDEDPALALFWALQAIMKQSVLTS